MNFETSELVKCAQREAALRKVVYKRWVETGRMDQETADREVGMMEEIAARLLGTQAEIDGLRLELAALERAIAYGTHEKD
jgi:hypothetical protein